MSLQTLTLAPNELMQSRKNEVIGAAVPLLILPTAAVTLRLLSRWMSRAGFWVRGLICVDIEEEMTDRIIISGMILPLYWPACVPPKAQSGPIQKEIRTHRSADPLLGSQHRQPRRSVASRMLRNPCIANTNRSST